MIVEETYFMDNIAASSYLNNMQLAVATGGFRISGGLTLSFRNISTPSYTVIRNCTFTNNSAMVHKSNLEDSLQRPSFYVPRGHGGALLVFFQNSSNHKVIIEECLFYRNTARLGGGAAAVLFYRGSYGPSHLSSSSSTNNTVVMDSCIFSYNMCDGEGGAIGGHAFEAANYNRIMLNRCGVVNNFAGDGGGGFSFSIEVC